MTTRPLPQLLRTYRSELIMAALVLEIILSPLADTHPYIGGFLAVFVMTLVIIGTTYAGSRGMVYRFVIPIACLWLIARMLEAFGDGHSFYTHLAPALGLVLSCSLLWAILIRFESLPLITSSIISEAFASYLIIAIAFSQLYWILDEFLDHPFNQVIRESQSGTLLYFSMITLSSVGYGDIVPVNPYVRIVAALESMIGIFYVAVVVARLVSSYRKANPGRQSQE